MVYAIYPKSIQKIIRFNYPNSINYKLFNENIFINDQVKIVYDLLGSKNIDNIFKFDFLFTAGPIIVSGKVKNILKQEEDKKLVQFFPIFIEGCGLIKEMYALHIVQIEDVVDLNKSIYSSEFFLGEEKLQFNRIIFKDNFDWDLTICRSLHDLKQIVVRYDLKDRLIEAGVKKINYYSVIDNLDDSKTICITT